MTLTNNAGLPEPLVEAIRNDSYSQEFTDYSVTELVKPPRISALRRAHSSEMSEDASDRIFSLIGQGIHSILERAASNRYIVEERFGLKTASGVTVSGRIDLFDQETKALQDWKITSRFATKDGPKPEWTAQGNLNRLILERNGIQVKKIEYVAIYRDWSKMAVARGVDNMPEKQVEVIPIEMWTCEETDEYLAERIRLHEEAKTDLPMCSDEDRWYKPPKFALMKKKRKRAIKLYPTEAEALAAVTEPDQYIEARKDEHTRCLYYCECAPYCTQFRDYMQDKIEPPRRMTQAEAEAAATEPDDRVQARLQSGQ